MYAGKQYATVRLTTLYLLHQRNYPACLVLNSSTPCADLHQDRRKTVRHTASFGFAQHSAIFEEVLRVGIGWHMGESVPASHCHRFVAPLDWSLPS